MFEIIFGGIFAAAGLIAILTCVIVGIAVHETVVMIAGSLGSSIFLVIGIVFLVIGIKKRNHIREIINQGTKIPGRIIAYMDDTSLYVNDVPGLDIIVQCDVNGTEKVCRLATNQTKESKFPLGAEIMLSILGREVVYVPGSVQSVY